MTTERTPLGREIETALGEVLAHVHGEITARVLLTVIDREPEAVVRALGT